MPDPITENGLMTALRVQLDSFAEMVETCCVDATMYKIPHYPDGNVPDVIDVESLRGDQAIEYARKAFCDMSRPSSLHPWSVSRYPGVVRVDKDLSKVVFKINILKKQLHLLIKKNHKKPKERTEYCKRAFPGRVMLQAYRKIYCNNYPATRVELSWSPKTMSSQPLNQQEAYDKLVSMFNKDGSDPNNRIALQKAIEGVGKASSDTDYAIKRPRMPYPVANIGYEDDEGNDVWKQVALSLPLVLYADQINIGRLESFDKDKRRGKRSDTQKRTLIYKPLYLYQIDG